MPDYVSEAEYHKLLAENKARAALFEAAKLPKVAIEGSPGIATFRKMSKPRWPSRSAPPSSSPPATRPPVDQLHDILLKRRIDRAKLTSPRWQAEFDLAIGRCLANKARLDGYNSMIAALKRGKTFQNPEAKTGCSNQPTISKPKARSRKWPRRPRCISSE